MREITAWIVESRDVVYGPFLTSEAAGVFLGEFRNDMALPVMIKPVMKPLERIPRRDITNMKPGGTWWSK